MRIRQKLESKRPLKRQRVASAKKKSFRKRNLRVAGFLGIEQKFYDTSLTPTTISNSWTGGELDPATVSCISAPAMGDGPSERDGRKIVIKKVLVRGTVKFNNLQTVSPNNNAFPVHARILVVWDKQTNGTQLSAEDVVVSQSRQYLGFRNLEYSSRFTVLMDKTITLERKAAVGTTSDAVFLGVSENFELFKDVEIPVTFVSSSAGVSSVTDNSIHVIGTTDASALVTCEYEARIRFVG